LRTVVVQNRGNHEGRPGLKGDWEWWCTQSVQRWAAEMGYDYRRTSFDQSFDWYPSVWNRGMNQILALHQPEYDRVIQLENDTYIFGTPSLPDGDFVVRESYIDMGRLHCRTTTTLISARTSLAANLVAFVAKQCSEETRDPRVQTLIEHEKQPRVSDEEITRIWCDDNRQWVTVIPSTRRDSSSVYGVNHVDWVYPDQFVHIGKSEKQWQWGEQMRLMRSDDPVELQKSWLYSSYNGWDGMPDDHGMNRWDDWLSSKNSQALRAQLDTGCRPGDEDGN
jgi:hypothetical protein